MEFHFVLVSPARAENVGAAARALKTMGFASLRIVNSHVHTEEAAHWVAHGAQELLSNAKSYPTLAEAIADIDLVVATTARQRGAIHHYLTPAELKPQIVNKAPKQVAILFGCEESGLSNEELAHADLITMLPLKASYPSLNLGQAIMLYAYELSSIEVASNVIEPCAEEASIRVLKQRAQTLLQQIGVGEEEKLHQWLCESLPLLAQRDLNLLHLLCKDLERAVKK